MLLVGHFLVFQSVSRKKKEKSYFKKDDIFILLVVKQQPREIQKNVAHPHVKICKKTGNCLIFEN